MEKVLTLPMLYISDNYLEQNIHNLFQGTLTAIMDWFRDYKIPDGKPANKFGLGNKPANKVFLKAKKLVLGRLARN